MGKLRRKCPSLNLMTETAQFPKYCDEKNEGRHTRSKRRVIFIMSYFTLPYSTIIIIIIIIHGVIPSWFRSVSAVDNLNLCSIPIFLLADFHDMINIQGVPGAM
jgi:hypothetical protein